MSEARALLRKASEAARIPSSRGRDMPLDNKVLVYATCLTDVGRALQLMRMSGEEDAKLHLFARQVIKYIQTKMYWLFAQEDLVTPDRVPSQEPPPRVENIQDTARRLEVEEEIRRVDASFEKAWADYQG